MREAKKFEFETPLPETHEEDDATLAAIDAGLSDADAGKSVPAEAARKQLDQWISDSSTRKNR